MSELDAAKNAALEELGRRSAGDRAAIDGRIDDARNALAERSARLHDLASPIAPEVSAPSFEAVPDRAGRASFDPPMPAFATNLIESESAKAPEKPKSIATEMIDFDVELPRFNPELFFE